MNFKKAIFSLMVGLFVLTGALAQGNGDLKGPKYKNHKPWKDTKDTVTDQQAVTYERAPEKGPQAKNRKAWQPDKDLSEAKNISSKGTDRRQTGPKAKNAKPWNRN